MNITETRQILDKVSAIDNRKITPESLDAWHDIIGRVPFDIATAALKLAQQDPSVKYLKPGQPEVKRGTPQPRCRDHNELILNCDPCCHRLMKWEEAHGSKGIHDFALAEIYA